jgi:hypothetical protein
MAARNREGYRKEIGEDTPQKCTRALNNEEEEEEEEKKKKRKKQKSSIRCLKSFNVHVSVLSFLFDCVTSNTAATMLSS